MNDDNILYDMSDEEWSAYCDAWTSECKTPKITIIISAIVIICIVVCVAIMI